MNEPRACNTNDFRRPRSTCRLSWVRSRYLDFPSSRRSALDRSTVCGFERLQAVQFQLLFPSRSLKGFFLVHTVCTLKWMHVSVESCCHPVTCVSFSCHCEDSRTLANSRFVWSSFAERNFKFYIPRLAIQILYRSSTSFGQRSNFCHVLSGRASMRTPAMAIPLT